MGESVAAGCSTAPHNHARRTRPIPADVHIRLELWLIPLVPRCGNGADGRMTYTPRPAEQFEATAKALPDAANRADDAEQKAEFLQHAHFDLVLGVRRTSGRAGERRAKNAGRV